MTSSETAKEIFFDAIQLESVDDRRKYLARVCGGDEQLRRRVEAWLTAHEDPQLYLRQPDSDLPPRDR